MVSPELPYVDTWPERGVIFHMDKISRFVQSPPAGSSLAMIVDVGSNRYYDQIWMY